MADEILSSFLVKIIYDQDERSRKKFDEGLKQIQTRAAEFGAKIDALPTIVSDATKRISASLSEMYYSAQKNGATARELDALRYAAEQSGEGANKAESSFNAFSQRIRDFATGAARQYKSMFGVDVDPNHTFDAFLKVREKIEEIRNRGGPQNLSQANLYARTFGIDEDALIAGRLEIFNKSIKEQLKRNEGIAAEKAIALNLEIRCYYMRCLTNVSLVSVGAYTAGEAVRGWLGGGGGFWAWRRGWWGNDHRVVHSETNIHVASASPRDLMARPLGRPKNADIIKNTASYAA